jgi:hypothetical protein
MGAMRHRSAAVPVAALLMAVVALAVGPAGPAGASPVERAVVAGPVERAVVAGPAVGVAGVVEADPVIVAGGAAVLAPDRSAERAQSSGGDPGSDPGADPDGDPSTDDSVEPEPGIIPRPDSGRPPTEAGDRGGALQIAVLLAIVVGVGLIAAMIVRESRRNRAVGRPGAAEAGRRDAEPQDAERRDAQPEAAESEAAEPQDAEPGAGTTA